MAIARQANGQKWPTLGMNHYLPKTWQKQLESCPNVYLWTLEASKIFSIQCRKKKLLENEDGLFFGPTSKAFKLSKNNWNQGKMCIYGLKHHPRFVLRKTQLQKRSNKREVTRLIAIILAFKY